MEAAVPRADTTPGQKRHSRRSFGFSAYFAHMHRVHLALCFAKLFNMLQYYHNQRTSARRAGPSGSIASTLRVTLKALHGVHAGRLARPL